MSMFDEINSCRYLYLERSYEPSANQLCLVLCEGIVADRIEPEAHFPDARPIEPVGRRFEVDWETYVGYCIKNESHATPENADGWSGAKFSALSQSRFLDYMRPDCDIAEFVLGRRPQHWAIVCLDHVIEVISISEPRIRLLAPPSE